jgi:hypothetical protein
MVVVNADGPSVMNRARRGVLLLGALEVIVALLMCVPAVILEGTGNRYAHADAIVYLFVSGAVFVVGGLLAMCGAMMRRGRLWPSIVAIVLLALQSILFTILLIVGWSEAKLLLAGTGIVLTLASLLSIIQIAAGMMQLPAATPRGFAPVIPTAPVSQPPPLPREN